MIPCILIHSCSQKESPDGLDEIFALELHFESSPFYEHFSGKVYPIHLKYLIVKNAVYDVSFIHWFVTGSFAEYWGKFKV